MCGRPTASRCICAAVKRNGFVPQTFLERAAVDAVDANTVGFRLEILPFPQIPRVKSRSITETEQ
jgi:hypothetical protein